MSDPGVCVYSILELSPGESKHLLISCPDCLPVAASLCTSLYSVYVLEVQQQQDILELCFPRLKNPKHAVIFTDCAKKMKALNIEQIPVIGVEGDLVGLVRASDLIKALVKDE